MSNFSIPFIRDFPRTMIVERDGAVREAPVDWVEGGYLSLVGDKGLDALLSNMETQIALGCDVEFLEPHELKARYPSMFIDDLAGGVFSPRDGWCDPSGFLQGFKRKGAINGRAADGRSRDFIANRWHGPCRNGTRIGPANQSRCLCQCRRRVVGHGVPAGVPLRLPMRRFRHYFTCNPWNDCHM